MKKFLFLNADATKPQCAVYQAGKIYADAMALCKEIEIQYEDVPTRKTNLTLEGFDGIIFNYQHVTMQHMDPSLFSLPTNRIGFLYEARRLPWEQPMHYGGEAMEAFNIIISPDPTLVSQKKVWGVPRVIPRSPDVERSSHSRKIISTYGFPSPWKDLRTVIEMMNDEFDTAVFRMNFGQASHQIGTQLDEVWPDICGELSTLAKPGITVEFTRDYKTDEELIRWLAHSDVNVFLANSARGRHTGGALLASTDLAISARRPIMVSDTIEARHLAGLKFRTLREAMARGEQEVRKLYDLWSPRNFVNHLDSLVREYL